MKNNNKGFISMSLVYSFLIVFVAISTSLLAIYTENIMQIRRLNNEIKAELMARANKKVLVFENLIYNGSFETNEDEDLNYDRDWTLVSGTGCKMSNKNPNKTEYGVQIGQAFYGEQSIEAISTNCHIRSKHAIKMTKNHIYYIERIYSAGHGYPANSAKVYFTKKSATSTEVTPSLPNMHAAKPFDPLNPENNSWVTPSVNNPAEMGSVDVDLFKFTGESDDYYIDLTFTGGDPIWTDGYSLYDITAAVGKDLANSYMANDTKRNDIARKIWRTKAIKTQMGAQVVYSDQSYFEGRKVFSALGPDSIK